MGISARHFWREYFRAIPRHWWFVVSFVVSSAAVPALNYVLHFWHRKLDVPDWGGSVLAVVALLIAQALAFRAMLIDRDAARRELQFAIQPRLRVTHERKNCYPDLPDSETHRLRVENLGLKTVDDVYLKVALVEGVFTVPNDLGGVLPISLRLQHGSDIRHVSNGVPLFFDFIELTERDGKPISRIEGKDRRVQYGAFCGEAGAPKHVVDLGQDVEFFVEVNAEGRDVSGARKRFVVRSLLPDYSDDGSALVIEEVTLFGRPGLHVRFRKSNGTAGFRNCSPSRRV